MSNYTQTNIYRKQMQELGLNTKQYAELIEMPYEVVKDIIYDKEGDYSMEIKSLLRRNMMNKHQEIENDFENAKIKALELKQENNSMNWYINEYTPELLKEKLKLKSRKAFEDKYNIIVDGKSATHWFYVCITGKVNYDNHEIRKDVVKQFVEQLYDILVNRNEEKYLRTSKSEVKHKQKTNILKWYKNFDFMKYLKENDMTRTDLAINSDVNYNTLCHLMGKKRKLTYETKQMRKLYNYINNNVSYDSITEAQEQDILENTLSRLRQEQQPIFMTTKEEPKIEVLDTTDTSLDNLTSDKVDNSINQIEIDHDNNAILRMILVKRLTDEEKLLIELFGGKIC